MLFSPLVVSYKYNKMVLLVTYMLNNISKCADESLVYIFQVNLYRYWLSVEGKQVS